MNSLQKGQFAALHRIEGQLGTVQAALSVAQTRDAQVQRDILIAATKAKRETLRELLCSLSDVAKKADTQMAALGHTATDANHLIQQIHALGVFELNSRLVTVVGWFRIRLLDSCADMPGCLTGSDLFKTGQSWPSRLPHPDEVDRLVP